MLVNSSLTVYHKVVKNHEDTWEKHFYKNIWWFGGKGSSINKGYENANDVDVRIPYDKNDIDISNLAIGDIVIKGTLDTNITTQQDLNSYEVYNITSINDNNFGINPHIHLGGK